MSVYEEVCRLNREAEGIYRILGRLIDEAERESEKAVLRDARKLSDDLMEKLFQARVVTNPRG